MGASAERNTVLGLVGAFVLTLLLAAWTGHAPEPVAVSQVPAPTGIFPDQAYRRPGEVVVLGSGYGKGAYIAQGADGAFASYATGESITLAADQGAAARLLATPISLNWRHPFIGQPVAQVLRIAGTDGNGRTQERLHTILFQHHGALPVVSLQLPTGALLDPDTGIMVVGNAIFQAPPKVLIAEARDPKWWKYPGNFHMRGKEWERRGRIQYIDPDGTTTFECPVGVRINGQMTRGFPQHAFRLNFDEPLLTDLFEENPGDGYKALVLRAGGNDQIKAMLRDVFQHTLCAGLPFETSGYRACVVYLNGAYWGVHELRPRMDEREIARRYGIKKKNITILEDEARYYYGDLAEVNRFRAMADRTRQWDGRSGGWADTLEARMDVEGFITYMASQMIFGNMDWPNQNVRFWRYTGKPRGERPLDGRWYFIMGDSDLGYGAQGSPQADMFLRVKAMDVPITRLFWGLMRTPKYKARFISIAQDLVEGPLSTTRALQCLDRIESHMAPEMDRHTARWRKPADRDAWQAHVEVMRTFARERSAAVSDQLRTFAEQP